MLKLPLKMGAVGGGEGVQGRGEGVQGRGPGKGGEGPALDISPGASLMF